MGYKVLILFLFLGIHFASAQEFSNKEIKKNLKAKKIEVIDPGQEIYRVQSRTNKKWGIFRIYNKEEIEELIPCKFDSVGWFKGYEPFLVVKNKGKYGILLNPYEIQDAADSVKCIYDAVQLTTDEGAYYALVKKDAKWGLIDWFDGFLVVDYSEDRPEDVPLTSLSEWKKPLYTSLRKKLNADLIDLDEGNEDGVVKVRNKESFKWGMYQVLNEDEIKEIIPMKYDSLEYFGYNGKVTPVYNDGRIGFYLSSWSYGEAARESVPCVYEDYQRFVANKTNEHDHPYEVLYMAVKKEGKWGWIDWETGEKKSEFVFETRDTLPYPNW